MDDKSNNFPFSYENKETPHYQTKCWLLKFDNLVDPEWSVIFIENQGQPQAPSYHLFFYLVLFLPWDAAMALDDTL